jgi:hypothetical protein
MYQLVSQVTPPVGGNAWVQCVDMAVMPDQV